MFVVYVSDNIPVNNKLRKYHRLSFDDIVYIQKHADQFSIGDLAQKFDVTRRTIELAIKKNICEEKG